MLANATAPAILAYAPLLSMLANATAPACLLACLLVVYYEAVEAKVKSIAAFKRQYSMDIM